jgi:hypothetical protein
MTDDTANQTMSSGGMTLPGVGRITRIVFRFAATDRQNNQGHEVRAFRLYAGGSA